MVDRLLDSLKMRVGTKTTTGRVLLHRAMESMHASEAARRRRLAQEIASSPDLPEMTEEQGFLDTRFVEPDLLNGAVAAGQEVIGSSNLDRIQAEPANAHYELPWHTDALLEHPFLKLALHPDMLAVISRYFGLLPILRSAAVVYSPNNRRMDDSSQTWHLDLYDMRVVHLWLPLVDVDETNGPLVYLSAAMSGRIVRAVGYRYRGNDGGKSLTDEKVRSLVDPGTTELQHVGPAGAGLLIDGARCLHYGSRKGTRPRFTLRLTYTSPFSFSLPWKWERGLTFAAHADNPTLDPAQANVLGIRR